MKSVGIFEAKTHLTGLCEEVNRKGKPIMVSRRGKPLVVIGPVPETFGQKQKPIYEAWVSWGETHGEDREAPEFPDLAAMRDSKSESPLEH